jgi:hypothetical protein
VNNVDNIPIGQLPMALAIAIDKVRDLAEAPTVTVEHRLKISQDDLKKAFSLDSDPIEVITTNHDNEPTTRNHPIHPEEVGGSKDQDQIPEQGNQAPNA